MSNATSLSGEQQRAKNLDKKEQRNKGAGNKPGDITRGFGFLRIRCGKLLEVVEQSDMI